MLQHCNTVRFHQGPPATQMAHRAVDFFLSCDFEKSANGFEARQSEQIRCETASMCGLMIVLSSTLVSADADSDAGAPFAFVRQSLLCLGQSSFWQAGLQYATLKHALHLGNFTGPASTFEQWSASQTRRESFELKVGFPLRAGCNGLNLSRIIAWICISTRSRGSESRDVPSVCSCAKANIRSNPLVVA